ncbi:holin [Fervidibacillus albus]|uniref:Holin n=1 Tax=Fervidibacillus albus TaxID=2980026 RepID=A0A9E8LWH0_9BACI|nr:holin [Fervidibacillus albus]WAA10849.1 holin [Fervidibacillus albus]
MFEIGLIIAVVVGLVELVKRLDIVPTKYLPLISLTLGIVTGLFYLDGEIKVRVFNGIIIGLSASGLFDQTKIMKKGEE